MEKPEIPDSYTAVDMGQEGMLAGIAILKMSIGNGPLPATAAGRLIQYSRPQEIKELIAWLHRLLPVWEVLYDQIATVLAVEDPEFLDRLNFDRRD